MIDIFIPSRTKYSLQLQLDLYRFHFFMEGFKMNYRNLSYIFLAETWEHSCWNFYKRFGDCLRWWLVSVFVTLHSAKYWMKAPKLVKTKKSQLKVPVTTTGRKMQFFRNSNRRAYLSFFSFSGSIDKIRNTVS